MTVMDLLARDDSILLLVDIQERLLPVIHDREGVLAEIVRLASGAALLSVPTIVTEQYPKGLGPTVAPVLAAAAGARVLTKSTFACGGDAAIIEAIRALDRGTVVIAGLEAHICVLQTALDLRARGFGVHVVADAAGARFPRNHAVAMERMARAGATVTCVESVLFEWMGRCDAPEFKAVQALLEKSK
jgi:nicotinamidase-related amidase